MSWVEAATYETRLPWAGRKYKGFADVLAIRTNWTTRKQVNRAQICEIKVSRSDLLADLRESKMHKYERFGQCVLVMNHTASRWKAHTKASLIKELRDKGLPDSFGITLVPDNWNGKSAPLNIRKPANCKSLTDSHMQKLSSKMLRSLSYRCLRGGQEL